MQTLKTMAMLMLIAGAALGVFAWWGLFTAAGKGRFDEMAGIIPLLAGVASVVLLVGAAIFRTIAARR